MNRAKAFINPYIYNNLVKVLLALVKELIGERGIPSGFAFSSRGIEFRVSCSFNIYDSTANIQAWSYEFPSYIPNGMKRFGQKMIFTIRISSDVKHPFKLFYHLSHNKDKDIDTLFIDLSKCQ
jgi:hypothetical protein